MSTTISVASMAANRCVPRGRNELHTVFEHHFDDFCARYDEKYAATYARYRLARIRQLGKRFTRCGAEMKAIAIIEDPDELRRILRHPGCRAEQQP